MSVKSMLPWQARIVAKVILSRIPIRYAFWKKAGFFEHGEMQNISYVQSVFNKHTKRFFASNKVVGFTMLELGPGDSIYSALLAWGAGARKIYLVDAGNFINRDVGKLLSIITELRSRGIDLPMFSSKDNIVTIMQRLNITYLTEGSSSLAMIKDSSVDFIWSNAVLEHIRKKEVPGLVTELARIMTFDGMQSHRIDFKDHLGGSLNNLRFSEQLWEKNWMATSGFYTNRYRLVDWLNFFELAGLEIKFKSCDRWNRLPVERAKISAEFQRYSEQQLLVSGCDLVYCRS